jgi:hypothetical protein
LRSLPFSRVVACALEQGLHYHGVDVHRFCQFGCRVFTGWSGDVVSCIAT